MHIPQTFLLCLGMVEKISSCLSGKEFGGGDNNINKAQSYLLVKWKVSKLKCIHGNPLLKGYSVLEHYNGSKRERKSSDLEWHTWNELQQTPNQKCIFQEVLFHHSTLLLNTPAKTLPWTWSSIASPNTTCLKKSHVWQLKLLIILRVSGRFPLCP